MRSFKATLWNVITWIAITSAVSAQTFDPAGGNSAWFDKYIEGLTGQETADPDLSEMEEEWEALRSDPIDLNTEDHLELLKIPFLSHEQVNSLHYYLLQYGHMFSIYELCAVDGFNMDIIRKILPFVIVSGKREDHLPSLGEMLLHGKQEILLSSGRVQENQLGYQHNSDSAGVSNTYLGDPLKLGFRYGFNYHERFRFGFGGSKDAGEEFFRGNNAKGFDAYSGFIYMKEIALFKYLVLGDYKLAFGQGLAVGAGSAPGLFTDAVNMRRSGHEIRPRISAGPGRFFRGAAGTLSLGFADITGFFSSRKTDATIDTTILVNGETPYQTVYETGLHRTEAETARKNRLKEECNGFHLLCRSKFFTLGATWVSWAYDKPPAATTEPYQVFNIYSGHGSGAGADINIFVKSLAFYAEFFRTSESQNGALAGLAMKAGDRLAFTLVARSYSPGFRNPFSNAFRQNTLVSNEEGLYMAVNLKLNAKLEATGSTDLFRFPWLKYQVDAPSAGNEDILGFSYRPSENTHISCNYRYSLKQVNGVSSTGNMHCLISKVKQSLGFEIKQKLFPAIEMTSKVQMLKNTCPGLVPGLGYLLSQAVHAGFGNSSLGIGYCLFSTDTYNERIYCYEEGLPASFPLPGFYDRGSRWYGLIKLHLGRRLECWAKYSRTTYTDKMTVGTGLDMIQGNHRSDVAFALRIQYW